MDTYAAGFVIGGTSASLTNNHPLSVTYAYGTDPPLKDPSPATKGNGDPVDRKSRGEGKSAYPGGRRCMKKKTYNSKKLKVPNDLKYG